MPICARSLVLSIAFSDYLPLPSARTWCEAALWYPMISLFPLAMPPLLSPPRIFRLAVLHFFGSCSTTALTSTRPTAVASRLCSSPATAATRSEQPSALLRPNALFC
eukprot:scaffold4716_cov109-Isochrysis_galbana.AAC.10